MEKEFKKQKPSLGLLGVGEWGQKLLIHLNELGVLKSVYDKDFRKIKVLKQTYKELEYPKNYEQMIQDKKIQGLVIATSIESHYEYAKRGLIAGKDVYVEKPLVTCSIQAEELVDLAREREKILMVGHILNYQAGIQKFKEAIPRVGKLHYVSTQRLNWNSFKETQDILWSLAIHDIALVLKIFGEAEESFVIGTGFLRDIQDQVTIHMQYKSGLRVNIFASRLLPYKKQKMVLMGSKGVLIFEEKSNIEKLSFYEYIKQSVQPFGSCEWIPFEKKEALREELKHYIECILERKKPYTDGEEGLKTIRVIEKWEKLEKWEKWEKSSKEVTMKDSKDKIESLELESDSRQVQNKLKINSK